MKFINIISIALFILIAILNLNSIAQDGLSVHGYLTQGFAFSTDHQIHGIPTKGTSDYRNLALQFRYDVDDQQNFIIQFSHERLGLSPIMQLEGDVELDWAYYEYKLNDIYSMKVGKIQMPFGIYNEFRDVGTLLPFYRIPYAPYGEGNYMSETVDGIVLKYSNEVYKDWDLDSEFFLGSWNWLEWANFPSIGAEEFNANVQVAKVRRAAGFKLWLNTPIEGIGLGSGFMKGLVSGGISFGDLYMGEQNFNIGHVSFDGDFDPLLLQSEFLYYWLDNHPQNIMSYYIQTGYNIFNSLSIYLQTEYSGVFSNVIPSTSQMIFGAEGGDFNHYMNHGLGLKYDIFTYFSLKIEYHWFKGFAIEDKFVQFLKDEPYKTQYSIFSIATSF